MASSIIHLAVAKKVKEEADIEIDNPRDYYLGSIAPDISKQIGETKEKSHFLINTHDDIPNINLFIKRYPTFKYNSFDLGYYTHLYTDKRWQEEIYTKIVSDHSIKLLNGEEVETNNEKIIEMLYSDYTNLNIKIIEDYDLDLSLCYEEFIIPETNIREIPINQLDILLNKMGLIIENSKEKKAYSFDDSIVKKFIEETAKEIIENLKKY